MAVAVVVAAGQGERLGHDRPKALVELAGRPMLEWSVRALEQVPEVREIVVVLPADHLDAAPPRTRAVAGGTVRSQSVALGLTATSPGGDPVIVHDAARPLAEAELFGAVLAELERSGADAVIAATPVSDTIKQVSSDGASVERTLPRARLWAVQTPQVFRRRVLERALEAPAAELGQATDDAWLVERAGGTVRVLESSPRNIKVTTPLDLRLAEMLLSERGAPA